MSCNLGLKCQLCKKEGHFESKCGIAKYTPNISSIIHKSTFSKPIESHSRFTRIRKCTFDAMAN